MYGKPSLGFELKGHAGVDKTSNEDVLYASMAGYAVIATPTIHAPRGACCHQQR